MKRTTVVFPTIWDRKQIASLAAPAVDYASPDDLDCRDDFDVLGFIDEAVARLGGAADTGVTTSSDYPGAVVAAAIAARAGLAGADPAAILRCNNKYAARVAMQPAVPEATPAFALVYPPASGPPSAPSSVLPRFPLFVKPVRGAFSAHSAVVANHAQLDTFLARSAIAEYTRDYLRLHHRLQACYAPDLPDAAAFLVEEILRGHQVTVEAFAHRGEITILGVVDSILHPGTRSFARFEYPSALPHEVQDRMQDITRRAAQVLGLDQTLFNIEMMFDPATGRIGILEVNPRICGQFADLYDKVDGTHGYAVALALAHGEAPVVQRGAGPYAHAASIPLRVFVPTRVGRAPTAADIVAAEALHAHTLVWVECATGDTLCDFDSIEDGASVRYAVINVGAPTRAELIERANAVQQRLGFVLEAAAPHDSASAATRRLAAEYDKGARAYADYWAPAIAPMAAPLVDALASVYPGARRVLDLGCGSGSRLAHLQAAFPHAAILGVDRSAEMVRLAKHAARGSAVSSGIAIMDAQMLAIASDAVDVALLAFVLFHMPDPQATLREVHRVVGPGGLCGLATWAPSAESAWDAIWRQELDAHGAAPDPRDALVTRHDLVDTADKVEALLAEAAFANVRVWQDDFVHPWTPGDLMRMQSNCGMPARRLASLGPGHRTACCERVSERIAGLTADDLVSRPRVIFAIGRRHHR